MPRPHFCHHYHSLRYSMVCEESEEGRLSLPLEDMLSGVASLLHVVLKNGLDELVHSKLHKHVRSDQHSSCDVSLERCDAVQ